MCDPIPGHIQLHNRQKFVVRMMEITRSTPEELPDQLLTDIALDFRGFLESSRASHWVLDSPGEGVFDAFFGHVDDLGGMINRIFDMILATDEDLGLPGDVLPDQELMCKR
jgi:hypothetical protein